MKKYFINLSDPSFQKKIVKAIGFDNITEEQTDNCYTIDNLSINTFIANIFNRSNGILVIGSYGKTTAINMLRNLLNAAIINPYYVNLGKEKEFFINGDGFCLLNPGMNLELIKQLRPSITILTGISKTNNSVKKQIEAYKSVLEQSSVGIIMNKDCPQTLFFDGINSNTLLYSSELKADIFCTSYKVDNDKIILSLNKDIFIINSIDKEVIFAAMIASGTSELLGFNSSILKKGIENYIPPLGHFNKIGTISDINIFCSNSLLPSQIKKSIKFLSKHLNKITIIFNPDESFFSEDYEDCLSYLPKNSTIGICGDGIHDKNYENMAKQLRKLGINASFHINRRETIKKIISQSGFNDNIILLGKKGNDFEDFCNNIWITLESKSI